MADKQHQKNYDYLVSQGVTADFISKNKKLYDNNINFNERNELLKAFRAQSGQVYSAVNLTGAMTNPVPRPDDLLGIRNQINTEVGLPQLQTDYQTAYQNFLNRETSLDTQQATLEGQLKPMDVIVGEQAQARRLGAAELSGMARGMEALQARLQAAQMEANQRYSIREQEVNEKKNLILQYPGAKITFADDWKTVEKKINKYNKKMAKEAEEKAEKQMLKQMYAEVFGTLPKKGMSMNEVKKKLKKRASSDREYEEQMRALELAAKKKSLKGGSGGKVGKLGPGQSYAVKAVNDAKEKVGDNWGAIAQYLEDQDYPIGTGSEIDLELNRRYNQENYERLTNPTSPSIPKKVGTDSNGEDIFVDPTTGERVYWIDE